jgi:uncharacterized UPF0160 family protein
MASTIVVHDGRFHADDALAVYLLRQHPQFSHAKVIRTRDAGIIETADVVCDCGGIYDHECLRYDHHQTSFDFRFPGGSVNCASCGLVYFHYGREILDTLIRQKFGSVDVDIDELWEHFYHLFVESIDGLDNGISPAQEDAHYFQYSTITSRIERLGPHWKEPNQDVDYWFMRAVDLIGRDFEFFLFYAYKQMLARATT